MDGKRKWRRRIDGRDYHDGWSRKDRFSFRNYIRMEKFNRVLRTIFFISKIKIMSCRGILWIILIAFSIVLGPVFNSVSLRPRGQSGRPGAFRCVI